MCEARERAQGGARAAYAARSSRTITREVLEPQGVAVVIEGSHHCMTTRGIHRPGVAMVTSSMLGAFRKDSKTRREFLAMIGNPSSGAGGGD